MIDNPCKAPCRTGPGLNTIKNQISYAIEQGKRILEGGLDWSTFTGYCKELRETMVEFFSLPPSPDQRIQKLREETKNVVEVVKKMKGNLTLSRSVEDFINMCEDINTHIEQQLIDYQSNTLENRLKNLNEHINDISKIIETFKSHGVVTTEANEFLLSCKKIQTKLDNCVSKIQNDDKIKGVNFNTDQQRLREFLKRQLSGVEIMTQDMIYEGAGSKSLENFLNACHDFRAKLEEKSVVEKLPDTEVPKLMKRLEEAIELSKAAKLSGFTSKNVDNFIKYCQRIKNKLALNFSEASSSNALSRKQEHVINSLEDNINNIIDVITKMRLKGHFSDSLEDFVTTCYQIKQGFGIEKDVNNIPVIDIDKYMEDATCKKSCECKIIKNPRSPKSIVSKMPLHRKSTMSTTVPENASFDALGLHETRIKKIITLKRFKDKTGVMNEQTDTVVLRESSYDPTVNFMPEDNNEDDDVTVQSIEVESYKDLPYNSCGAPSGSFASDKRRGKNKTVGYYMEDHNNQFKEARKAKSMFIFRTTSSTEPLKKRCISYSRLSKGENVADTNVNLSSP